MAIEKKTSNRPAANTPLGRLQTKVEGLTARVDDLVRLQQGKQTDAATQQAINELKEQIAGINIALQNDPNGRQIVDIQTRLDTISPRLNGLESTVQKLVDDVKVIKVDLKATRHNVAVNTSDIHALHQRLAEDHDTIETTVLPRLVELGLDVSDLKDAVGAGTVTDNRSFQRYMIGRGVKDEDLRNFLVMPRINDDDPDLDLTDPELFDELLRYVRTTSAETMRRLTKVEGRVDTLETDVTNLKDNNRRGFEPKDLLIGAIPAVLLWLFLTDTGKLLVWQRFVAAFAVMFGVALISSFFGGKSKKSKSPKPPKAEEKKQPAPTKPPSRAKATYNAARGKNPDGSPASVQSTTSTKSTVITTKGSDSSNTSGSSESPDAVKTNQPTKVS